MATAAAVVVVAIATFEYRYTSADTSAGGGCDGRRWLSTYLTNGCNQVSCCHVRRMLAEQGLD